MIPQREGAGGQFATDSDEREAGQQKVVELQLRMGNQSVAQSKTVSVRL